MTNQEILSKVDHTLLKVESTWADIKQIVDDGMKYDTASVCIPASFVKQAADYIKEQGGHLKVCTVIGFPNGYSTTATKCFEAHDAVVNGAEEVDMVINVGWAKEGRWDDILDEINAIKEHCDGKLLKVIIETCLLTKDEIVAMCDVVNKSKAEYIKTSTGFSTNGATFEDVELMVKHMTGDKLVKAAGGIGSLADAGKFIEIGASRLGTSRVVSAVKAAE